jgi:hypothetical protein
MIKKKTKKQNLIFAKHGLMVKTANNFALKKNITRLKMHLLQLNKTGRKMK